MTMRARIDTAQVLKMKEEGKKQKEIAEALEVSESAVSKALKRSTGNITNLQQHKDTKKEQPLPPPEQDVPAAAQLDVEIAPAEAEAPESFLDKAKARLGFTTAPADVQPRPQSRRLTKGQQEFVDLALPIATEVGKGAGAWTWQKLAREHYHPILAPDDEIAEKIMAPWCRILARTFSVKYKGKITPNGMDTMASLAAIAGYGLSSWQMYKEIKREDRYAAQEESSARARSRAGTIGPERQAVESVPSHLHASGPQDQDVSTDGRGVRRNAPESGSVDIRSLSPAERFQYESLARLRKQDYSSRMRRSGIAS